MWTCLIKKRLFGVMNSVRRSSGGSALKGAANRTVNSRAQNDFYSEECFISFRNYTLKFAIDFSEEELHFGKLLDFKSRNFKVICTVPGE
jgi:hypothetical protein